MKKKGGAFLFYLGLPVLMAVTVFLYWKPINVSAVEPVQAEWVFGAGDSTPDYTNAVTGTLAEAFAAANGNTASATPVTYIRLCTDVEMTQGVTLNSSRQAVMDLNEKTFTVSADDDIEAIYTSSNSTLTVKNGTIAASTDETYCDVYGIKASGAVMLENCDISVNGLYYTYGVRANGNFTAVDCNMDVTGARKTYGIYSSGETVVSGGTVQAVDSSASGECYGVYMSYAALTIKNSPNISAGMDIYVEGYNAALKLEGTLAGEHLPYSLGAYSDKTLTEGAGAIGITGENLSDYFVPANDTYALLTKMVGETNEVAVQYKERVIFRTGNGSQVPTQYLPIGGGKVIRPADPTWTGYTFAGWYADNQLEEAFDFDKTYSGGTTVYAKWTFEATGAVVENSGAVYALPGKTEAQVGEEILSELFIKITGENGAYLCGLQTDTWQLKEGESIDNIQPGTQVTFVGTITEIPDPYVACTYCGSSGNGKVPTIENPLTLEVVVTFDYKVMPNGNVYTTNENGIMAYRYLYSNFDIYGYFADAWRQTTFGNGGYYTYVKVGSTTKRVSAVSYDQGGNTQMGLKVGIDFAFCNAGETLQIIYTVKNTTADPVTFSLGSSADIQIGRDDSAVITPFEDGSGYKMVSDSSTDKGPAGDYAQFNFFGKGYAGVISVSDFWYGRYSDWRGDEETYTFYGTANSVSGSFDSAGAWHWADNTLLAGEETSFTILIGIGGAGSENAAQGGGLNDKQGSVGMELTTPVSGEEAFTVYVDGTEAENALTLNEDYTIQNPTSRNPVITFTESAGLTCQSVIKVKVEGIVDPVSINNNIPHSVSYSKSDNVISASCGVSGCGESLGSISLAAPSGTLIADGAAKAAVLTNQLDASITAPTVLYERKNGDDYESMNDVPTNAGDYKASITMGDTTVSVTYTISASTVKIQKPAADTTVYTYNGTEQTYIVAPNSAYTVSGEKRIIAGSQTVTVALKDTTNYTWEDGTTEPLTFTFTIAQKELGISWGNTDFVYNSTAQRPETIASGVITGADIRLTVEGAQVNASATVYTATVTAITGADAANYKLPGSGLTCEFRIRNASQEAPQLSDFTITNESAPGQADGKISGLTTAMEYSTKAGAGDNEYAKITDEDISFAAGTYYVRYAAKTNYDPSPATAVTVTAEQKPEDIFITPGEYEDITPDTNVGGGKMTAQIEEIKDKFPVTEEEKWEIEHGADVDIWLEINDISGTVSAEDKALIAEKLENGKVGIYLDILMFKQVGESAAVRMLALNDKVEIAFKLPENLINTDKNIIRTYSIVHVHNETAEVIAPVYDANAQTLTFKTDKFSTYAVVYTDAKNNSQATAPATGDNSNFWLWVALALVSGGCLLGALILKRKKEDDPAVK